MSNYLELLGNVASKGFESVDRTGDGTLRTFGVRYEHDIEDGKSFPLLTTKKVGAKSIFAEMMWFLSGNTSIIPLHKKNVHIWDADMIRFTKMKLREKNQDELFRWEKIFLETDNEILLKVYKEGAGSVGNFLSIDWRKHMDLFDLGKVYGHFWRNQVSELSESLSDVVSELSYHGELAQPSKSALRRLVVSGWHPEVNQMVKDKESALPPCHALWQIGLEISPMDEGKFEINLDLEMYQRSADSFLGVPYNIASYGFLMLVICKTFSSQEITFKARKLGITFGDFHIYKSHIKQVHEQLTRKPRKFPEVVVEVSAQSNDLVNVGATYFDEIPKIAMNVLNYEHHGMLSAPLIVGNE